MLAVGRRFTIIERWEDAMLRLNELSLPPEFALAFSSGAIRPSRAVGGLGSKLKIVPPTKPLRHVLGKIVTGSIYVLLATQTRELQTSASNFVNFKGTRGRRKCLKRW